MKKTSIYKGVHHARSLGWLASHNKVVRGPFYTEEQAVAAKRLICQYLDRGEAPPRTGELKRLLGVVKDAGSGSGAVAVRARALAGLDFLIRSSRD